MSNEKKRGAQSQSAKRPPGASQPAHVQILDLSSQELDLTAEPDDEVSPRQPEKGKGGWLEEVPTTLWQGDSPEDPPGPPEKPQFIQQKTVLMGSKAIGSGYDTSPQRAHPYSPTNRAMVPVESVIIEEIPSAEVAAIDYDEPEPVHSPLMLDSPVRISIQPATSFLPDPRLQVLAEPSAAAAEKYRIIALKLKELSERRVIAITAPTKDGQGSIVASNVALALSEGSRSKVLLIDTNLRQPEVAELFNLTHPFGLTEQIRHHCRRVEDSWQVINLLGTFHLLPAGAQEKNPSALLSSEAMSDLMSEVRRAFDYIILSPPPVMESADLNILQDFLDGAILAVQAGITKRASIRYSVGQLQSEKYLGIVLLDAPKAGSLF